MHTHYGRGNLLSLLTNMYSCHGGSGWNAESVWSWQCHYEYHKSGYPDSPPFKHISVGTIRDYVSTKTYPTACSPAGWGRMPHGMSRTMLGNLDREHAHTVSTHHMHNIH